MMTPGLPTVYLLRPWCHLHQSECLTIKTAPLAKGQCEGVPGQLTKLKILLLLILYIHFLSFETLNTSQY